MGKPVREFESETISLSGLQPVCSKPEPRDIDGAASRRVRRTEGHDEAQRKVIIIRLIEFFEAGPSGPGDL